MSSTTKAPDIQLSENVCPASAACNHLLLCSRILQSYIKLNLRYIEHLSRLMMTVIHQQLSYK